MKYPYPSTPRKLALSIMLALGATSWNVWADTEDAALPEVKAQAAPIYPGSGDDIVRTGSKTDTPLRDIPASVAVVSADLLQEQGVTTMNDAMRNVSGVQPLMGGGYGFANNYTSRGLAINFLRDDMPDGSAQNGYWRTMYDIERIEVLKGPGSALYGSGGPGGSINIVTRKPQKAFSFDSGVTLGSYGTRNVFADVTGEITPGLNGRLIADVEHTDGFRDLERDIREFSPSLAWRLSDDKTLTIDFDNRNIKVKPDNYGILFDATGNIASAGRDAKYYSPMNYSEQQINRLSLTHDWTLSNALSMRTAFTYEKRDLDFLRNAGANGANAAGVVTGRTIRSQSDDADYMTLQNELTWKLNTGSIKHTVLAGLEYKTINIDTVRVGYNLANISNVQNPVIPETSMAGLVAVAAQGFNRQLSNQTVSVYAQDQITLTEQWKARFGLRNDHVRATDNGSQGATAFRHVELMDDLTTGSAGLVFQPMPNLSFYTGYSTGAFVNIATESTAISTKPETSKQVEIGSKMSLLNNKLDVNAALFKTQRENYFITLPGALSPTPDGQDETTGLELDVSARPMSGLTLTGNAVWMDPEVKSNTLASNAIMGVVNQSIRGNMPAGVSRRTASLWANYTLQGGVANGLTLGLGANYKDYSYADSLNLYRVPSYLVFDAAVTYRQPKWEAAVTLKNLTDKVYYTNATFVGALPGDPRSVYATLRFDY